MSAAIASDLELRRAEAERTLNEIVDPCSRGSNVPIGMVDMGLVDRLEISGSRVRMRLIPTYPGCLFVGFFEVEATKRLRDLPWCDEVAVEQVSAAEGVWTEERMSPAARERLGERRRRLAEAAAAGGWRRSGEAGTIRR